VFQAMLGMQLTGTVLYAAALAAVGRFPALSLDQLPLGLALAALGLAGLILFYKALALDRSRSSARSAPPTSR